MRRTVLGRAVTVTSIPAASITTTAWKIRIRNLILPGDGENDQRKVMVDDQKCTYTEQIEETCRLAALVS
jgi:hypothetical protein